MQCDNSGNSCKLGKFPFIPLQRDLSQSAVAAVDTRVLPSMSLDVTYRAGQLFACSNSPRPSLSASAVQIALD